MLLSTTPVVDQCGALDQRRNDGENGCIETKRETSPACNDITSF